MGCKLRNHPQSLAASDLGLLEMLPAPAVGYSLLRLRLQVPAALTPALPLASPLLWFPTLQEQPPVRLLCRLLVSLSRFLTWE